MYLSGFTNEFLIKEESTLTALLREVPSGRDAKTVTYLSSHGIFSGFIVKIFDNVIIRAIGIWERNESQFQRIHFGVVAAATGHFIDTVAYFHF